MLNRLTQRSLNNVVIIAMLLMMALFNLDRLLPSTSQSDAFLLLSPDSYLLKVEHGSAKLERVGQEWRQVGAVITTGVSPAEQLNAWKTAVLTPVEMVPESILNQAPQVVVVWLAGEPKGLVYALYQIENELYTEHQGNWYRLDNTAIELLLPWSRS